MAALSSGAAPARKWHPQEPREPAPETPSSKHGHGQSPAAPSTPARAPTASGSLVASSAAAKVRASASAVAAGAAAASAAISKAAAAGAKSASVAKALAEAASETGTSARVPEPTAASAALAAVMSKLSQQPPAIVVAPSDDGGLFPDGTPKGAPLDMQPATPEKTVPPLLMQLDSALVRSPTSRRPLGSRRMSVSTLSPEAMLAEAMKLLPPREGSADVRTPMFTGTRAGAAQVIPTLGKESEATTAGTATVVSPVPAPAKRETEEQAQRRLDSELGSWTHTLKAAAATSGIDSGLEHLIKKPNAFLVTRPKRESLDPDMTNDPPGESPSQRTSKHSSYMIVLPKPTSIITKARNIEALPPTNSQSNIHNNSNGVIAFINSHAAASANSAAMTPSMAVSIGLAASVPAGDGEITPRTVDFNRVSNLLQRMTTRVSRGTDVDPGSPSQDPPSSHVQQPAVMIRSEDPRDAPRAPRRAASPQYNSKDNSFMNLSGATPGLPAVMNNKGRRGSLLCLARDGHPYSETVFHNSMESLRRAESDGVQPGTLTSCSSFNSLPPLDGSNLSQRHISMARYDTTNAKGTSLAMGIFRAKPRDSSDSADRTSLGGGMDYGGGADFYGGQYGGTRNSSTSGSGAPTEDGRSTPSSRSISQLQILPPADHHLIQKPTHTRLPAPVGVSRQRRGSVLF